MESITRRELMAATASLAALGAGSRALEAPGRPRKSVMYEMLPGALAPAERFALAREVGFEGVEVSPIGDEATASTLRSAAEKAGIPIHSVIYGGWGAPLSDPDPAVVERGMRETRAAMQSAKWVGAENILLVPAIVTPKTRYTEAYARSQKQIRALIPTAEKLNIMICVEEVWNKFLQSPLEFARYIDEFRHPLVQAYFDVGNVVINGYPEDWILTLGKRIKKIHLKDFKRSGSQWVNLLDGDVDWHAVRRALAEIGYTGFMNTELPGGDAAYLRDLSHRIDIIIAG